ncbi:B-type cyclin CLB5 KNAG_0A07690 [Huiozyma naganishii CBS 8797]|uniref:Uncharacterized protein n=1 Tax=Huiozyma naganishii (strain ATCC MYA-139 / BCRC 22969 / CBS 8797 / KCTC 17520 / NBRC 10181 / NCYC 3082 / Yp74L-3) TaxID=1071383 RepID=J7RUC0_HUIN7|nr:hypothetical protein KNAG_0A07690 [Kazachstania naganishii CBS 8797]CCK68422.1 hypothetical protein KNAG_0A07690 [Kazachstania naganishii CBS 8797]
MDSESPQTQRRSDSGESTIVTKGNHATGKQFPNEENEVSSLIGEKKRGLGPAVKSNRGALSERDANSVNPTAAKDRKRALNIVSEQRPTTREPSAAIYSNVQKKRRIFNDFESAAPGVKGTEQTLTKNGSDALADDTTFNTWEDLDRLEEGDVFLVPEYANDIFEHLYKRELETLPSHNYLVKHQSQIYYRPSVRAILIDWLVEVHEKFQCFPETLYLAINIMDRFFAGNRVATDKLQLVAVSALFMAAKFEEVHLPKLSEYAYITAGAATNTSIKKAELFMLTSLKFDLGWPNPLNFLRRISKADNYDTDTRNVGKLLLEHAICSPKFITTKPSLVAAMSMYIARQVTHKDKELWNKSLKHYSGGIDPLHDPEFQKLCKELIQELANPSTVLNSLLTKSADQSKYGSIFNDTCTWCKHQLACNFEGLFTL